MMGGSEGPDTPFWGHDGSPRGSGARITGSEVVTTIFGREAERRTLAADPRYPH